MLGADLLVPLVMASVGEAVASSCFDLSCLAAGVFLALFDNLPLFLQGLLFALGKAGFTFFYWLMGLLRCGFLLFCRLW